MTHFHRDLRARLTIVDVIYIGVSIAVLSFLGRPFYDILNQQAADLSPGVELLMQTIVPAIVVAMFVVIFKISVAGGAK